MVTKELLSYLENSLKGGYQEDDLRKALIGAGWNPQDVAEGFVALKTKAATPVAPASAPQTASQSPAQSSSVSPARSVQSPATTQILTRLAPTRAAGTPFGAPPHSRRKLVTALIVIVLLLLGGGGWFAYAQGYLAFLSPDARYKPEELMAQLVPKTFDISSASYKVSFSLEGAPRDADAQPFSISMDYDTEAYARDITRFRNGGAILGRLKAYDGIKILYPQTLNDLLSDKKGVLIASSSARDPKTSEPYEYRATDNRSNFELTLAFETKEALLAFQDKYSYTTPPQPPKMIEGTRVMMDKNYGGYRIPDKPGLPSPFDLIADQAVYTNYLPSDFSFSLALSGAAAGQGGINVDTRFQGSATFTAGDFAGSADAEFLRKDKVYYVRLNKFPSFFFDPNAIKGKWVKITSDDLASNAGDFGFLFGNDALSVASTSEQRTANALAQLKQFFQIAQQEDVFAVTGGEKETKENGSFYRYHLAMRSEKLPSFYKKLADTFIATYGKDALVKLDQKTLDYMATPAFQSIFDYFKNNGSLDILTDAKTGYPAQVVYRFRLVPDNAAAKLKDRQFVLAVALELSDVNNPSAITAPPDALNFDEAQALLAGVSKERFTFHKQVTNIQHVREGLRVYNFITGTYPQSLNDLVMTPEAIQKDHPAPASAPGTPNNRDAVLYQYQNRNLIASLPTDAFTNAPFTYTVSGKTYILGYTMKLPPWKENSVAFFDTFTYDSGFKTFSQIVVDGKNTATEKVFSQEAINSAKLDTDKDGVPDALEAYFGTDPKKKDSDDDTKSDYEELVARTNPLGAGPLETNENWHLMR